MAGAQSDSIGTGVRGSELIAGVASEGLMTHASLEVRSVFGSIIAECAASVAGSIHPSLDGAICSGLRVGAAVGVISRTPPDGRSKSCSS